MMTREKRLDLVPVKLLAEQLDRVTEVSGLRRVWRSLVAAWKCSRAAARAKARQEGA